MGNGRSGDASRRNGVEEIGAVRGGGSGGEPEDESNDSRTAGTEMGSEHADREKPRKKKEVEDQFGLGGVGAGRAVCNAVEVVHLGRSLGTASILVAVVGIGGLICMQPRFLPGVAAISYCLAAGLFYLVFRRWGRRAGPLGNVGAAELALMAGGIALLLSGHSGVRIAGLYLALAAIFICGASTGAGLAVVALRGRFGFWTAIRIVLRFEKRARSEAWSAAVCSEEVRR